MVFGGIEISKIKLILSIMALGMLITVCAAYGGDHPYDGHKPYQNNAQTVFTPPTSTYNYNNYYYDWLSPGTTYWSYPTYYSYNYYPKYYYTTPVTHYYTWYPAAYSWDPWYATNVYGLGSTTYYYSSSWSYSSGGFFFGP